MTARSRSKHKSMVFLGVILIFSMRPRRIWERNCLGSPVYTLTHTHSLARTHARTHAFMTNLYINATVLNCDDEINESPTPRPRRRTQIEIKTNLTLDPLH